MFHDCPAGGIFAYLPGKYSVHLTDSMRKLSLFLALISTLISGRALAFTPSEDGLYAVFDTSMGEFTCELFFEDTPQTVANFVGLAEGTQEWVNVDNALVQRNHPYFDDVVFHRVIEGFMIQAGLPAGIEGQGIGYNIYDEVMLNDSVHTFDRGGLLAMATQATPEGYSFANSGSSQFFVTVSPQQHLNRKHAIFGEVVEGMSVVEAINQVPTTNNVPDEDVVINSVTIIREGVAALAFDPADQGVPTFDDSEMELNIVDDEYFLSFDLQPHYTYEVSSSSDLDAWTSIGSFPRVYSSTGRQEYSVGLPTSDRGFWQCARAQYPKLPQGGITLEIYDESQSTPQLIFSVVLNEDLSGTFTQSGGDDFDISYYAWHAFGGDNVTLYVRGPALRPIQFYLNGGETGEALMFLQFVEQTGGSIVPEQFIDDISYEIVPQTP